MSIQAKLVSVGNTFSMCKIRLTSVFVWLSVWLVAAVPSRAGEEPGAPAPIWEPAKTRAFVVSLTQFQGGRMPSFTTDDRLDDRFAALLKKRGVLQDHLVLLKDGQATTTAIQAEFRRLLQNSQPGETLLFYFGSHGGYDAHTGKCWFVSYDGTLPFEWVFDTLERNFRGSQAIVTADSCHSGGIVEIAAQRRSRISYACLSSTHKHQTAWSGWRFLQCLLRGLEGSPAVDQANRGYSDLQGLADYTERYMAFAAEGKPQFIATGGFDPRLHLATTTARRSPRVGQLVEVASGNGWVRAEIVDVNGKQLRVHETKDTRSDDDAWVPQYQVRPPVYPRYAAGTRVELQGASSRRWFSGRVLDSWESLHLGHYDGYSPEYDEWFGPSRIRLALDGAWIGKWENDVGQSGGDSLVLQTVPAGDRQMFRGTWSGELPVTVERFGDRLLLLESRSSDRSYRGAGRIEGQRLHVEYAARGAGKPYFGRSVFQQAGKVVTVGGEARAEVAGDWSGTYENSRGGAGDDSLKLTEQDGILRGSWSGLSVAGERLGDTSLYLEAGQGEVHYRVVGYVERDRLMLGYAATDKRSRYTGQCVLMKAE